MMFGCQSMVDPIQRLVLKHPREAFVGPATLESEWRALNYRGCPDYAEAIREYDAFVALLQRHVPAISYMPADQSTSADSVFAYDPVIITKQGAILCQMGKRLREPEPVVAGRFLEQLGIPILARIQGDGRIEAGDVLWIDEHTLAVGRGYRTNDEGIRQLREITRGFVRELVVVPLPHWGGPHVCMHLMSLISLIDRHLAVTFARPFPVPFREWLRGRGIELLEVPDAEHETLGCNVLALAPRKVLLVEGNPGTKQLLEREGVTVLEYKGDEISLKGRGGPTCLTRPILRSPAA